MKSAAKCAESTSVRRNNSSIKIIQPGTLKLPYKRLYLDSFTEP